jgi:hypothetical protein
MLGTLIKVRAFERSVFGWYADSKNVVSREENGQLYLRNW